MKRRKKYNLYKKELAKKSYCCFSLKIKFLLEMKVLLCKKIGFRVFAQILGSVLVFVF